MRKILYLSDTDILSPGGAQESMKILIEELNEYYDFVFLTPNGKKTNGNHIVLKKYNDFTLRGKSLIQITSLIKDIYKYIKKVEPTIIHVQMPSTMIIISFLKKFRLLNRNIRIIYTDRGVYGKYGKITTIAINNLIKKCEKVITTTYVNKKNYQRLFKNFEKYKYKFQVIPNTAGKVYDYYNIDKPKELKEIYNIRPNENIVGFCGRYSEQKNWPLAKEIIKKLKQHKNLSFVIVLGTDGTNENLIDAQRYIEKIKGEIGNNRLTSFVNISNKQMSDVYYLMDFFVMPSRWESFGRTAVEAMSRKNIVLGRGVDGLYEVIGNDRYIFETSEDVSNILINLLESKEDFKLAKNYFYNRYFELYGYKDNVKRYKEIYDKVI